MEIGMIHVQRCPLATTCLFAKLITQNFPGSAFHENEIYLYIAVSPRAFNGFEWSKSQNLSL